MPEYTQRFSSKLKTKSGKNFIGTILPVMDDELKNDKFYYPKQLLRTPANTSVKPKDIIIAPDGTKYLVSEGKNDFINNRLNHKTFGLYKITHTFSWHRPQKIIDPVTQLQTYGPLDIFLGDIDVCVQPLKIEDLDQKLRIEQQTYIIFCGEDLQVNDKVNYLRIYRVLNLFGVTFAESQ